MTRDMKELHNAITCKGDEEQERAMFANDDEQQERKRLNRSGAGWWNFIMNKTNREALRELIAEEEKHMTGFFY